MSKYKLEVAAVLMQLAIFYAAPMLLIKLGPIMMVMTMLVATCIVGVFLGCWSNNQIKYLFPVAAGLLFIPSIPLYYNPSALLQAVWHFVVSGAGMLFGMLVGKLRA